MTHTRLFEVSYAQKQVVPEGPQAALKEVQVGVGVGAGVGAGVGDGVGAGVGGVVNLMQPLNKGRLTWMFPL